MQRHKPVTCHLASQRYKKLQISYFTDTTLHCRVDTLQEVTLQSDTAASKLPEFELSGGPHILTVASSEALANMLGIALFQLTLLTVLEWPVKVSRGFSWERCQMYTL